MINTRIKSKVDDKFFDQLERKERKIQKVEVEYGYYADKMHKGSDMPIGSLALIQEYGSVSRNIPARPFIFYSAVLLNDNDVEIMRKAAINFLFKKQTANIAFSSVGKMGVRTIQRSIMSQRFKPLAPSTVAKKGSSTILVENNELINGAEWKINENS